MKALLHPKKVTLTIITTNLLGRSWSNVDIHLTRVDDYFYHKPKEFDGKTDEKGCFATSVLEGGYLVQASTKKVISEELHRVEEDKTIKIKLPSIFGWRHKKETLHGKIIREFYEKFRTDTIVCFKCKRKYGGWQDAFKCHYCEKYFCSDHRLPEKHNCWGEPKAPPGGFREIIRKGKITVIPGK